MFYVNFVCIVFFYVVTASTNDKKLDTVDYSHRGIFKYVDKNDKNPYECNKEKYMQKYLMKFDWL